ncbi:right-handed parallel beta-helix repeat-containing protein [Mucilaginibacter mali]|uniref:Right-handed parallel beta-helix repeat-containing protein n=1 Tax=Mucilaginibacter mali TaxID=2740462 RepID=A0A7D4QK68_9SPHI|nr:polysaccharide lyase 6 family protein [Mucilaginibacter mali]QKJ30250.1 right-handed parallel beta-helix repeat-containing protein [Mucilaginibacter mali]
MEKTDTHQLRTAFNRFVSWSAIVLIVIILVSFKVMAQTVPVKSIADLQSAINKAKPGDVIILADGVYKTAGDIIVDRKAAKDKPITITAEHPGKAEIAGAGGFSLMKPATYIVISGFKFTHAASKAKTGIGTSFCRFTQNIFETPGDGEDLTIAGSDQEVDYNTFQNKNAMGRFIAIRGEGKQIAERLHIHHNYFNNAVSQGGKNGAEAFQFGLSGFSLSSSNSLVEYNLFEHCAGENELISVKASAVVLRYNTIRDCPAQFTLRHGNKSQVYGNYFFNTPGLRIFGDDHLIYSNYFEGCSEAITIGNGDGEVADGAQLTAHDRPDRVLIAFNTLVDNKSNIIQTARKDGMGATHITVANNIIQGGGAAATLSGPLTDGLWEGNILYKVKGAGNMPVNGYTMADPKLVKTQSGAYHIQAGSAAIDRAAGNYPGVKYDMDGQARTGALDAGADELSNDAVTVHVLHPGDVGFGVK